MVKLPLNFDKNEWFVLVTMVILLICFLTSPKILPRGMTTTIFLFFALLGLTADVLIGSEYPLDFYMIMDSPKLELFDAFIYVVNYAIFGYFFSILIIKINLRKLKLLIFLILWSGLNALLEWVSVKFNVFSYQNGWNTGFSAISYFLIYIFCSWVIKKFRQLWYGRNLYSST